MRLLLFSLSLLCLLQVVSTAPVPVCRVFAFSPSSSSHAVQEASKIARYNVFEPRGTGKVRDTPHLLVVRHLILIFF